MQITNSMKITFKIGDATAPEGPGNKIICHICNDLGLWGAGFVLALSNKWSAPEEKYREAWTDNSIGLELGEIQPVQVEADILVMNMVAQHRVGYTQGIPPIRYEALRKCLQSLATFAQKHEASVHMPRIGCGLAGGNWDVIRSIIEEELIAKNISVTVYDLI